MIERMGSNESINVDFRLITATNKNLQDLIDSGQFREDFFYRISSVTLEIPPLRERPEDIEDLVVHFVKKSSEDLGMDVPKVAPQVIDTLKAYSFPGNIRELKNIIERLVVFHEGDTITPDDLPERIEKAGPMPQTLKEIRQMTEIDHIKKVLEENDYKMEVSANILGITRRQLTNKVKEYDLKKK